MYGFSSDLEIGGLVGCALQQIRIGKYDVQFHYDSGTFMAVQGEARILKAGNILATWNEDCVWDNLSFQTLLNLSVRSYCVRNKKVLAIAFEDDFVLELLDDSNQYESVQIYPLDETGRLIVI
jgi:hypothetical protein